MSTCSDNQTIDIVLNRDLNAVYYNTAQVPGTSDDAQSAPMEIITSGGWKCLTNQVCSCQINAFMNTDA